jgi:hypothetical protein
MPKSIKTKRTFWGEFNPALKHSIKCDGYWFTGWLLLSSPVRYGLNRIGLGLIWLGLALGGMKE